jgi:hypothetical protein
MPNTRSHVLRTKAPHEKRLYWGAELSRLLILWLNSTKGTARNKRVAALLALIDRCTVALAQRGDQGANEGQLWWEGRAIKGGARVQYPFGNDEVNRTAEAIRAAFAKYSFRAELAYCYANRLLFDWVPAKRDWLKGADRIGGPSRDETHFAFTPGHAVAHIVELCHEGLIERVRMCSCGVWFYAKFSHMKFHSKACQQKAYRDDPGWREHRREYMKRNRALHAKQFFRSSREPLGSQIRRRGV